MKPLASWAVDSEAMSGSEANERLRAKEYFSDVNFNALVAIVN